MIPAAVEIRIAGIIPTRPSPIVSRVYFLAASPTAMSFCITPITRPPMMFTTVMMIPAIASPLTNFIAPSIAPNSELSRSRSRRLRLPSSISIDPERMSASIDICLPGIASKVKRAATSATRSLPLEMTMKFTTVRITKITAPTT